MRTRTYSGLLAVLLTLTLAVGGLTACGGDKAPAESTEEQNTENPEAGNNGNGDDHETVIDWSTSVVLHPLEYDSNYKINAEIPELIDGLEMPVEGATGYASVELPLWPENPDTLLEEGEGVPGEGDVPPEFLFPGEESPFLEDPNGLGSSVPEGSEPSQGGEGVPEGGQETVPGENQEGVPPEFTGSGEVPPFPAEDPEVTDGPAPEDAETSPEGGQTEDPLYGQNTESGSQENPSDDGQGGIPGGEFFPGGIDPSLTDPMNPGQDDFLQAEEPPDPYEGSVAVLQPGEAFQIIKEEGDWWFVVRGGGIGVKETEQGQEGTEQAEIEETGTEEEEEEKVYGWIEHRYCMINLPDVIPSILYDDVNAYYSRFASCHHKIEGVSGKSFYNSKMENRRLGYEEFAMPMLYAAARDVCTAQHKALAEGNCLVIYQTYRPYETQRAVVKALTALAEESPEVKAGVSTKPWSITWFISTGYSNHQKGYALDVSIVRVNQTETRYIDDTPYLHVSDYEFYHMPTPMHELSMAAISTKSPGSSELSDTMTSAAIALRGYFTKSGFGPLASEWWHFNDRAGSAASSGNPSTGRYYITECYSCTPSQVEPIPEEPLLPAEEEPAEDAVPEDTVPGDTMPGDTVPGDTIPGDTVPGDTVPGDTVPEGTVPGDTIPGDMVPGDTIPEDTVPEDTVPGDTEPAL